MADGYARNFLFPKHLAVLAKPNIVHDLAERQKKQAKDAVNDLRDEQKMAAKLDGLELDIKDKASEQGKLYAAVTALKVVAALKRAGYVISANQIIMKPIKELGNWPIKVKFRHGLEADILVIVTTEK